MMKWILIVAGVVLGIPAVLTLVGVFLPKGHRVSRTVQLTAPVEKVFAAISDPARIATSDPAVRVEESIASSRMVTRIADPNLPFGGTWTFALKPSGTGTELTITEDGEVYNPFFRTMQKLFFSPYKTIDTYQAELAKTLH